MSGDGMVPVVVRMPKAMHDALKRCAEREDRTMAQTLRRAVKHYLAEDESL